jgi:hypothetical protein
MIQGTIQQEYMILKPYALKVGASNVIIKILMDIRRQIGPDMIHPTLINKSTILRK